MQFLVFEINPRELRPHPSNAVAQRNTADLPAALAQWYDAH
jgi:hypothetical protein